MDELETDLSGHDNTLEHTFYFAPSRNRADDPFTYDSYGVSIYEYNPQTGRDIKWVASVDFRPGQAAAYVSVDWEYYSDLSIYYCTINWYPTPSGLRSGYHGPFWSRQTRWTAPWPHGLIYYIASKVGRATSARLALITRENVRG